MTLAIPSSVAKFPSMSLSEAFLYFFNLTVADFEIVG